MSDTTGQRADLGDRLEKVTVNCYCGCHRKIAIKVWPGTVRMPRMMAPYCKKLASEQYGDYFC